MFVMAIDYGDARTGVAFSGLSGTMTAETTVVSDWNQQRLLVKLASLAVEHGVQRIVVGCPLNMNGTAGERAEKSRDFAKKLAELTDIKTVTWDERLTTVDAHRILSDNNRKGSKRKATVDAVAASLILEGYLAYLQNTGEI